MSILNTSLLSKENNYVDKIVSLMNKQKRLSQENKTYEKLYSLLFKEQSKVSFLELKNINLFKSKRKGSQYDFINLFGDLDINDQQLFLDPTWGSIWSMAASKNHYHFGDVPSIRETLKILFSMQQGYPLHVSKYIHLSPFSIGYFIGFLYDLLIKLENNKWKHKHKISDKKKNEIIDVLFDKLSKKNKLLTTNFILRECNIVDDNQDKTIRDCSGKHIPQTYVKNKMKEYKKCIKEKKNCSMKIKYYEIQNKFKCKLILNHFFNLYFKSGLDLDMVFFFHAILSYLWCSAGTKKGIWDYYQGLEAQGVLFFYFKLNINKQLKNKFYENFDLETIIKAYKQKKNEMNHSESFELSKLQFILFGSVSIDSYQNKLKYYSTSFPDCGATSIRNFFKLVCYNSITETFDVTYLKKLKANQKLIEYFTLFNKDIYFVKRTKIKTILKSNESKNMAWNIKMDGEKDPFTAWSDIVQNLKDVNYIQEIYIQNKKVRFEIKDGFNNKLKVPNILVVFQQLFQKESQIKKCKTLKQVFELLLEKDRKLEGESKDDDEFVNDENFDNETGFGVISFKGTNQNKYKFVFSRGHYQIQFLLDKRQNGISYDKTLSYVYLNNSNEFVTMFDIINLDNIPKIIASIKDKDELPICKKMIAYVKDNEDLMRRVYSEVILSNNIFISELLNIKSLKKLTLQGEEDVNEQDLYLTFFNKLFEKPLRLWDLSQLEYLKIISVDDDSKNESSRLFDGMSEIKNLKILALDGCGFNETLPNKIWDMKTLEHLVMIDCTICDLDEDGVVDGCKIKNYRPIPKEIIQLQNLKLLQLQRFTEFNNTPLILPKEIWQLKNLEKLLLDSFDLKETPKKNELIKSKIGVLELILCVNVPEQIFYINSLSDLELDRCDIKKIPSTIQYLTNLKNLYIDFNMKDTKNTKNIVIPREIKHLQQLQTLKLVFANIKKIPKEIRFLQKLEVLDMTGNQLTEIPKEISSLKNLKELSINKNEDLKTLPKEVKSLKNLKEIEITDTQIHPSHLHFLKKK